MRAYNAHSQATCFYHSGPSKITTLDGDLGDAHVLVGILHHL